MFFLVHEWLECVERFSIKNHPASIPAWEWRRVSMVNRMRRQLFLRLPAAAEQSEQAETAEQRCGGFGDLLHQLEAVDRKVIRECLADAEVERDVSGAIGH